MTGRAKKRNSRSRSRRFVTSHSPTFCLSLALLGAALAQQPEPAPETKITVAVRRVPVDVIVTDGKGNPVRDLKKEELIVYEDGEAQPILSFDVEDLTAKTTSPLAAVPDGFVSNYSAVNAASLDLTVILFDELNTPFLDALSARDHLEHFLRDKSLAGRPVSLLVLNRNLIRLHDFTTQPSQLLAAFRARRPFLAAAEDAYVPAAPQYTRLEEVSGDKSVARQIVNMQEAQRNYQATVAKFDTLNRVDATMAAMQAIAHSLHDRPGRKRLIWISAGFPMSFRDPGRILQATGIATPDARLRRAIERTSFLLTAARVSVYPVDARGLNANPFPTEHPEFDAEPGPSDQPVENQMAMMELADETGGKVYVNRNDLDRAAKDAVNDGDFYYAITYRPPESQKDSLRTITVKTTRHGVKLRYRKAYFAAGKDAAVRSEIRDVAVEPLWRNEVPFAAQGVLRSERLATVMAVLPASALRLPESKASLTRTFEVAAIEGIAKGKPRLAAAEKIVLSVPQAQRDDIERNGLKVRLSLLLREPSRTLRLVLRDAETGRAGSLDIPLAPSAQ